MSKLVIPKITIRKKIVDETGFIDLTLKRHTAINLTNNENALIIEKFQQLIEYTELISAQSGDKKHSFRKKQFINALSAIKSYPNKILTGDQAKKEIDGIGAGIAKRIDEILITGDLTELLENTDPRLKAILDLTRIPGIGVKKAIYYIDNFGINSLIEMQSALKSGAIAQGKHQLTHQMMLGIKYFEDLRQRIPHSEIVEMRAIVGERLSNLDPKLIFEICGSFRRQRESSGDIDILVCHPDVRTSEDAAKSGLLSKIINRFVQDGLLIDKISMSEIKYMGYTRIRPELPARHIDILVVPVESWACALMYFTGSAKFNVLFRAEALKKGYTLNEFGMYSYINGIKADTPVPQLFTEQDIFQFLGIKYLTPVEREF